MAQSAVDFLRLGGPVVWCIAGLSVIALAVVLERLFFAIRSWENPEPVERALCEVLYKEDPSASTSLCKEKDTSIRRLFLAGVNHWQTDRESLQILLEGQIRREIYRWSKGLSVLSAIARIAPLLGLLGTVLGMVDIFQALPKTDQTPMVALAGGIWKALLTTVAGLAVAVPAVLCHSVLSAKVDDMEETLARGADFLLREKMRKG
ncbi:MAG: MotA/TolQ/ExbB proton channel family protein [Synergistales bacterium]|nr:MotA/TolQ/ExbB proton channel family protein [Synergistales bacterium]